MEALKAEKTKVLITLIENSTFRVNIKPFLIFKLSYFTARVRIQLSL